MLIEEVYPKKKLYCFSISDTIGEVLAGLEDFDEMNASHFFIEDEAVFLGAIRAADIQSLSDYTDKTLSIAQLLNAETVVIEKFAVLEKTSFFEYPKAFRDNEANIIPIIDKNQKLVSVVTLDDFIGSIANMPICTESGFILIVETIPGQYSMSEISQIVESNNGKLYGAFVSEWQNDSLKITLKISGGNISSIGETFKRYGYRIAQKFYTDEQEEALKENYHYFKKYLEF
ncbi:CBS domain-containing protein [Riemerella columbipharyngis]|uniref:CBS domain-containing protein n=1 Tax=Riemerella columbipharyngis TaxID=1071918 RepID=A0A1G7CX77_9FLAO|nr:CBS domain-containing protein [Riemerella columbipharyngis]SDE43851.1 hypothetical protein SAMN05421544_10955 [Riemerella columbipharyngis]